MAPLPFEGSGGCDCSGFVAWSLSESRHIKDQGRAKAFGNWIETSAMERDATGARALFEQVALASTLPGDVLVYGDRGAAQGHAGIIAVCEPGGPVKVIHCSRGNERATGDAIRETDAALFLARGAIAARWKLLDKPLPPA